MPEVNTDATLLIATSWQALGRAETGDERTMICNCTIIIIFAAFFIEANANQIIDHLNEDNELKEFAGGRPGLKDKVTYIYNRYISENPNEDKKQVYLAIKNDYPEFIEIWNFRNDVSHGVINRKLTNLMDAKRLRREAKNLVDDLFEAVENAGTSIDRGITYNFAISSKNIDVTS